jgi:hypothetical protein
MWEAALQSGGLDLFDVPTIYRLSSFYNSLNAGFVQLDQLRALSETILIPNLDRGPEEFYDSQTGELLPKYSWYIAGLTRLGVLAASITAQGDSLVADLSR